MTDKKIPPGICPECYHSPENHLRAPEGRETIYCPHRQGLAFRIQGVILDGWQLYWPVPPGMMDELVQGTLGISLPSLKANRSMSVDFSREMRNYRNSGYPPTDAAATGRWSWCWAYTTVCLMGRHPKRTGTRKAP